MIKIVAKEPDIPIVRRDEPEIFGELDNIVDDVKDSFADSVVLLTNDLQRDVDFSKSFDTRNLPNTNKEIDWNNYKKELENNIRNFTDIVSDKVLEFEGYNKYHSSVKTQVNGWINQNARSEALDIAEKSKKGFRQNYNGYFEKEEEDVPRPLIIKSSLGLPLNYTKAVNNFLVAQREKSTFREARENTLDYIRKMRRSRGELIAKTELWETLTKTRIMLHDHLFLMGELNKINWETMAN